MKSSRKKRGYTSEPLTFTRKMVIASFDHEIVDGAPAARFMRQYADLVGSGSLLNAEEISG